MVDTDRERCIQLAIDRIANGESVRSVAIDVGIPRTTLQRRIHGAVSRNTIAKDRQKLPSEAEALLIDWIVSEEAAGNAPSLPRIAEVAEVLLSEGGGTGVLGKNWVQRFVARHSSLLKIKRGRLVDIERIQAINNDNLRPFFLRLEAAIQAFDLSPFNIWNMDETGTQEGDTRGGRVVGSQRKGGAQVAKPSNTAWVSAIECISAAGFALVPAIVFSGKTLQSSWMTSKMPDWHYQSTPSGWTNTEIAFGWLKEVFLPKTKPIDGSWRLLILDGFATHIDHNFQLTALRNRVQLLYLPAHTSHGLQPLDVSVFAPLKQAYRSAIRSSTLATLGAPASKQRFLTTYEKARNIAMNSRYIRIGFSSTGIWPFNPAKMLKEEEPMGPYRQPTTPAKTLATEPQPLFYTPIAPNDVVDMLDHFQTLKKKKNRAHRHFGVYMKKGLARHAAQNALLRTENIRLQAQIAASQPKRGRKVKIDPNELFAKVEDFEEARVAQEAAEAAAAAKAKKKSKKYDLDAKSIANQLQGMKLEDLLFEWQLE